MDSLFICIDTTWLHISFISPRHASPCSDALPAACQHSWSDATSVAHEDNASASPAKYSFICLFVCFFDVWPRAHLRPHPLSLCWEQKSTSQHSNGRSHPSPWCVATPWGLINTTHCASIWLRVIKQIQEGDRVGGGSGGVLSSLFPPLMDKNVLLYLLFPCNLQQLYSVQGNKAGS